MRACYAVSETLDRVEDNKEPPEGSKSKVRWSHLYFVKTTLEAAWLGTVRRSF